MKKTIIIAVALFAAITFLTAQKTVDSKKLPAAVTKQFSSLYATVENANWKKDGKIFEADFSVNNAETAVFIDAKGNMQRISTKIKTADMPELASAYVAKTFAAENLTAANKVIYYNDGKPGTHYECETSTNILVFDRVGNFQGTMKKK